MTWPHVAITLYYISSYKEMQKAERVTLFRAAISADFKTQRGEYTQAMQLLRHSECCWCAHKQFLGCSGWLLTGPDKKKKKKKKLECEMTKQNLPTCF